MSFIPWTGLLIVACVAGLFTRLQAQVEALRAREEPRRWRWLAYPDRVRVSVVMLSLYTLALCCLAYAFMGDIGWVVATGCVIVASFSIFALYEVYFRQVRFDATEIQSLHPWGRFTIRMGDIEEIDYLPGLDRYRVKSQSTTIFVPRVLGTYRLSRFLRYGQWRRLFTQLHKIFDSRNSYAFEPSEIVQPMVSSMGLALAGEGYRPLPFAPSWDRTSLRYTIVLAVNGPVKATIAGCEKILRPFEGMIVLSIMSPQPKFEGIGGTTELFVTEAYWGEPLMSQMGPGVAPSYNLPRLNLSDVEQNSLDLS